jgi:hypothetical protein
VRLALHHQVEFVCGDTQRAALAEGEVLPLARPIARLEPECAVDPQDADAGEVRASVWVDRRQPARVTVRDPGVRGLAQAWPRATDREYDWPGHTASTGWDIRLARRPADGENHAVHGTYEDFEAGLAEVRRSPQDRGRLELIVRRPAVDHREILDEGTLDREAGLVGDTWRVRGSTRTDDGSAHPDMQLNVMNARAAALVAGPQSRWALAGDQLYVDLDLSDNNMPPGTRLAIGSAVIEITAQPHRGCAKFLARFGKDALRFVNSEVGVALHLRGVNARVVQPGKVHSGDMVCKVDGDGSH